MSKWSCLLPYEYDDEANTSWYCNFDWQPDFIGTDQTRYLGNGEFVDRLSDTNREYGEKALKPRSLGWYNWIGDQTDRCVRSGKGYIEYDNADYALERDRSVVMETYKKANERGLAVILKNPTARDIAEFGHLDIAGCVFERGTMSPLDFAQARKNINPNMQATWVRHGGSQNGQDIPSLRDQVKRVPGTSVQWGPEEYNGMRILESNTGAPTPAPNSDVDKVKAAARLKMAKAIVDFEARRDRQGHLMVYELPANDGGGEYEVAGINQKYDREACDHLVALIHAGKYDEAENYAEEYIAKNTDGAQTLTHIPSVESYLRDTIFNRGLTGCVKTLQHAIGTKMDGIVGPMTRAAITNAEKDPNKLLTDMRAAREWYEYNVVSYRSNFWDGLVNRWNKSLAIAKTFPNVPYDQVPPEPTPAPVPTPTPIPTPAPSGTFKRNEFALAVANAMIRKGYKLFDTPGQKNIIYVEGWTYNLATGLYLPNEDEPDYFNDLRTVLFSNGGFWQFDGTWQCTTRPGKYYTQHRLNSGGAANIVPGQYQAWKVGLHRGLYEALVQRGTIKVARDDNEDYSRVGDDVETGDYEGVNQHHAYDASTIGMHSAGCLVGRFVKGHQEFMAIVKSDPRYKADHNYMFWTTVLEQKDIV